MSVKNVTIADIALVELLAGKTSAPPEILQELKAKGHVTLSKGRPSLTSKGKRRARALSGMENDLRRLAGAGGSRLAGPGDCVIRGARV